MNEGHQKEGYSWHSDDLAELSAWQGYEFWSAQLETEIEFLAAFEQIPLSQLDVKESASDVLPF